MTREKESKKSKDKSEDKKEDNRRERRKKRIQKRQERRSCKTLLVHEESKAPRFLSQKVKLRSSILKMRGKKKMKKRRNQLLSKIPKMD